MSALDKLTYHPAGRVRRYCWRTGGVYMLDDGEKCPECASPFHKPVDNQDECSKFAPCPDCGNGHPCQLPIGHEGPCWCEGCGRKT